MALFICCSAICLSLQVAVPSTFACVLFSCLSEVGSVFLVYLGFIPVFPV